MLLWSTRSRADRIQPSSLLRSPRPARGCTKPTQCVRRGLKLAPILVVAGLGGGLVISALILGLGDMITGRKLHEDDTGAKAQMRG